MRKCTSTLLSIALGITPVLTSAQGIPPNAADEVEQIQRVGNTDYRPTRRLLRKRARGRQATEASTFLEYRMEYRELQQQRTLENLSAEQRRARAEKNNSSRYMERRGERMMETHERMAPRRATGEREGMNLQYLPSNRRSRPGETRLSPDRDPCLGVIRSRRAQCYYRIQRGTMYEQSE